MVGHEKIEYTLSCKQRLVTTEHDLTAGNPEPRQQETHLLQASMLLQEPGDKGAGRSGWVSEATLVRPATNPARRHHRFAHFLNCKVVRGSRT